MVLRILPEQEQSGGLSLQPVTHDPDPVVMRQRIERAVYGMSGVLPTETVPADYRTGNEPRLRAHTADSLSLKEYQDSVAYAGEVARISAAEGRPLTEQEQELILNREIPRYNPNLVLEILYARRYTEDLDNPEDGPTFEEASEEDPQKAQEIRNYLEDTIVKQEIARRVLEEAQQKWADRGLGLKVLDFAKGVIPGYTWFQQRNRIADVSEVFQGSNLESQRQVLWGLNPEEFELRLRQAVDDLGQENALEAMSFAASMIAYGGSDVAWDNFFTGMDIADVATLGALSAAGVASYARKAKAAARTSAESGSSVTRDVAQGNIQKAAEANVSRRLDDLGNSRVANQINDLRETLPDILNPEKFFSDAGSLSAEATRRLLHEASNDQRLLLSTFTELPVVRRVPQEVRDRAFTRAWEKMRELYPNLEDSVINISRRSEADEVFGGVDYIDIKLGETDATPISRESRARFLADRMYRLPKDGYEIVEEGGGYVIRVTKNVDETDLQIQDLRIQTGYKTENNFYNTFLSLLDSGNNQLSAAHNAVRAVANYGGEAMLRRISQVGARIGALSKSEARRLGEVMDAARFQTRKITGPDGEVETVTGRFFKSAAELEMEYVKRFNRTPTEKEVSAYYAFRNLMDYDYLQRNAEAYRDLARQGVEQMSIAAPIPIGEGKTRFGQSEFFNARIVDNLPDRSAGDYTVGWYNQETGKVDFGIRSRLHAGQHRGLQELLDSGDYRVLQPVDPRDANLRSIFNTKNEGVDFIVVKKVRHKPLASQQVNYNEGGHLMYPHTGYFLKQASTVNTGYGRRIYTGDTSGMYFQTSAEARTFEKAFNQAREMLRAFKDGEISKSTIDTFIANNLPYKGVKQFSRMFEEGVFDLDTPFVVTSSGQRATDVLPLENVFRNQEIVDSAKSPFNLDSKSLTRFTQERSERLLSPTTRYGGQENPIINLRPAPVLNSMETLRRSMSDVARSRFMNDYKHREVENWAGQFADLIDAPRSRVLANPMEFIKNPKFRNGVGWQDRQAAMTARRNILTLLEQYSDSDSVWRYFKQKTADGIYQLGGTRAVDMVEPLLWNNKTDPVAAVRGFAFDAKLGLMNIIQLPLQASAASMAMAIDGSPIRSAQAVLAYPYLRARLLAEGSPQIGKKFGGIFNKSLGIPEEQLDEMYNLWRNTGFDHTGGSLTYLNDYLNPSDVFSGPVNRARDATRFFFREGNNIHKSTSFILSYLRWRQANPKARLDNAATEQIVSRANTYYLNMSRNSDAAWQHPSNWLAQIAVLPGQFFAFQHRLTSLMIGKELTGWEKARLLAVNSVLWGVPIGGFGTLVGSMWPIGDTIRQYAMEMGYEPEAASTIERIIMDGVVDMGVEQLLGHDFNVSDRFGPGGLDWLQQIFDGEFVEAMGAAPNFVLDVIGSTQPLTAGMLSIFFDENGDYMNIVYDDVVAALRQISSVNNAHRAYMAYSAGLWLTKKEGVVANLPEGDPLLALGAALSLTPQEITDTYLRMDSLNAEDDARRAIMNEAIVYFERGLRAYHGRNKEQGDAFFRYANAMMAISGLTPLQRQEAFSRAARSNQSLVEQIDQRWMLEHMERYMNSQRGQ